MKRPERARHASELLEFPRPQPPSFLGPKTTPFPPRRVISQSLAFVGEKLEPASPLYPLINRRPSGARGAVPVLDDFNPQDNLERPRSLADGARAGGA